MPHRYVRFEATVPDRDGRRPGMFTLLRHLRTSGRLTLEDEKLAAALVARSYELHDEPPEAAFGTEPRAVSWFLLRGDLPAAADLLALAGDVVLLLDRYGIGCREVRGSQPGRITYVDDVQVVAVPQTAAETGSETAAASPLQKSVTSGSASNPAAT